jgi:plastocyanin
MKRTLIISTACALATLLLAAPTGEHPVIQKDKEFSKTEITIKPGEKVIFQNDDSVTHNVFSNSKINPFNIKVQPPGQSSTVEFKDEGVTEVRCAIHPKMKLLITVKQ